MGVRSRRTGLCEHDVLDAWWRTGAWYTKTQPKIAKREKDVRLLNKWRWAGMGAFFLLAVALIATWFGLHAAMDSGRDYLGLAVWVVGTMSCVGLAVFFWHADKRIEELMDDGVEPEPEDSAIPAMWTVGPLPTKEGA